MRISDWSSDVCSSDLRVPLSFLQGSAAEGDALVERHVVADLRGLTDHDAHAVVDEQPLADPGAGMDLDAGDDVADMRDAESQQVPADMPRTVPHTMDHPRVDAGGAHRHSNPRTECRIALGVGDDSGETS